MSFEEKVKEKYKDDLDTLDDIEELILDSLGKFPKFTEADKKFLEKFTGLSYLSLNMIGLSSLENFPKLPQLLYLELNDNAISGPLTPLAQLTGLERLDIENNKIANLSDVEPLKELKQLQRLTLARNPIAESKTFRADLFKTIPSLQTLDGKDKDGNEVYEESEEDYSDDDEDDGEVMSGEEGASQEAGDDDEDGDFEEEAGDEEEEGGKKKKGKPAKKEQKKGEKKESKKAAPKKGKKAAKETGENEGEMDSEEAGSDFDTVEPPKKSKKAAK